MMCKLCASGCYANCLSEPLLISHELIQPWGIHEHLNRAHLIAWQLPPALAAALPEEHGTPICYDAFAPLQRFLLNLQC